MQNDEADRPEEPVDARASGELNAHELPNLAPSAMAQMASHLMNRETQALADRYMAGELSAEEVVAALLADAEEDPADQGGGDGSAP
jgi:hypothetical protein